MASELRRLLPLIAITATILALALIASITTQPREYRTTPREERAIIVEFLRNTTQQLDLNGWWPRNGAASPSACPLDNGRKGASYDFDLWVPRGPEEDTDPDRPAQREHYADLVASYWHSLGMKVTISATAARYPTVYATGGPVVRAAFDTGASDQSYSVVAVAHCSPGDAATLLTEDNQRYNQGIRIPGDEDLMPWDDPSREEKHRPQPPRNTTPPPQTQP
ncbi:hypothetical protein C5C66_08220 [Rathayibacter toxicus]|uniref:Uncharacterized protein n=1 Tax=Rathayibacter toxicus TaxID=145458 RepID=A0A0C5BTF3_9MICO|nr:hypothetical protein [Rathayibacter toxicus]AJM77952.1 hypothetical protein TI83_08370 [Rathayibacter toxicus]ALS57842.1 hypothetical protein APU90_08710 [Rathayibacter toxicus]KKM46960.1 hypothetical protein VT73_01510 [Rathayibacter toxicus]PPG20488.1 hypothetical protein C5D15_08215 [Rathayibacter toxicus]PPG45590.1 hypothetical protein C5D16_08185 [Rathayibacter toxicus]